MLGTMQSRSAVAALALTLTTLAGCAPGTVVPVFGGLGADIAIFHRSVFDMLVSGISGEDCSVVRMDRGQTYCRHPSPPIPPQPYCTRSLGVPDCWVNPQALPDHPPQIADGPSSLTAAQNQYRLRRWPGGGEDVLRAAPRRDELDPGDPN